MRAGIKGVFISLLLICLVSADPVTVKFLKDFFREKNVMITAYFCWKRSDLKHFLKIFQQDTTKQIALHSTHAPKPTLFHHLSTDNYFLLDLRSCNDSISLLDQVNETNLFRYPLKYLLLTENDYYEELISKMENFSVYPNSEVVVALITAEYVDLKQYYRVGEGRELCMNTFIYRVLEASGLVRLREKAKGLVLKAHK